MTDAFKQIDPATYVDWTQAQWAQKSQERGRVQAEFVDEGTEVETIMASGLSETTKTAGADGGYKVTNPTGEQYLVEPSKFQDRYEESTPGIFVPKFDPVKVSKISENVTFEAPWGGPMNIEAGGVLVYGGENDIYGIQPDEFAATYDIITGAGESKPSNLPKPSNG